MAQPAPQSTDWRTADVRALLETIVALDDPDEAARFFRDLCTLGELRDMAQRWAVVRLLDGGAHYGDISRHTGASTATITRIAAWLRHGEGGYQRALERARSTNSSDPARAGRKAAASAPRTPR